MSSYSPKGRNVMKKRGSWRRDVKRKARDFGGKRKGRGCETGDSGKDLTSSKEGKESHAVKEGRCVEGESSPLCDQRGKNPK